MLKMIYLIHFLDKKLYILDLKHKQSEATLEL